MRTRSKHIHATAWLVACLLLVGGLVRSGRPAVAPVIAGNRSSDSVRVTVSINDTLGNAADADTIVLLWSREGNVFDSTVATGPGFRTGQYLFSHRASDSGLTGNYQVFVRARVQGRAPITNYSYAVIKGGLLPSAAVTDSNLARAATAADYRADLSACGLGTGAVPCTLSVVRVTGGDTTALQGVYVRAYNSDETATAAAGTTDANGRIVFSLAADTFHVYGYQAGYQFAPRPETVIVSPGGVTDTLRATSFDPGLPATADLCRVYGWVKNLGGDTLTTASIHARINQSPLRFQNVIISPYEMTATTDSTGYWFLDLLPNPLLSPDTTRYEFTIRFASGAILRRAVVVPDSSRWLLSW